MEDSATGFQRKRRQLYSKAVTENFATERVSDELKAGLHLVLLLGRVAEGKLLKMRHQLDELHLCN
jgi:hypothetical protein